MTIYRKISMLLCLALSGCTVAIKKETIVERAGTVVILEKDTKTQALVPDSTGSLSTATITLPRGSECKIGVPQAPLPTTTNKATPAVAPAK